MTRLQFGGGPEDVYQIQDSATGFTKPGGGAQALLFSDQAMMDRITDLTTLAGQPITFVTTETGSDVRYALGQIAPFLGPDGVFEMWCSVAGSPAFLLQASNLGGFLKPHIDALVQLLNAEPMRLGLLADVDAASIDDGAVGNAVVKLASGQWGAGTVASGGGGGGTGDVTTNTVQTITATKTFSALQNLLAGTLTKPSAANAVAAIVQALASQTANLNEWRDSTGSVRSWVGPDGLFYSPNVGTTIPMGKAGALANGTGTMTWFNDRGVALKVRSVRASVGTAVTTGTAVFEPKVNGTSFYTVSGNRPSIAAGAKTSGKNTGFTSGLVIPDGGSITVDISGTYTGGADTVFQLDVW